MKEFVLLSLLFLILNSCSNTEVAGATSETTNGYFATTVVGTGGFPEVEAEIYLRAVNKINEVDTITAVTDKNGKFKLENVPHGEYFIEIVAKDGMRALTVWSVDSSDKSDDSLPTAITLKKPGRVFGGVSPSSEKLIVTIPGLNRTAYSDTEGLFTIDSLPAGIVNVHFATETVGEMEITSTTVRSGEPVDLGVLKTDSPYRDDSLVVAEIIALNNLNVSVEEVTVRSSHHIKEILLDNYGDQLDTIPPTIKLLRLNKLSLGGNSLQNVPDEITEIVTLEYLDLSRNGLLALPEDMGNLKACSNLDIGSNKLTSLPESIVEMTAIPDYGIYLDTNYLVDLPQNIRHWVDVNSRSDTWEETQMDPSEIGLEAKEWN